MNNIKTNQVYICGEIVTDCLSTFETYGEKFYEYKVAIKRLSGNIDILPITVSERLHKDIFKIGDEIKALGQIRSYNRKEDNKSRLILTIFITDILTEGAKDANSTILCGHICKPPIYRMTPNNREIADIIIAVNRGCRKSDYIPLIVWGRNARFVKDLAVGDKLAIAGRIQSRNYYKNLPDNTQITKTAYEVSVSKIVTCTDDFDIDKEFTLNIEVQQ